MLRTNLDRIAFVGLMGAGKDTVASIFKDTHKTMAFGTGIREVVKVLRDSENLPHRRTYDAIMYMYKHMIDSCDYTELSKILDKAYDIPRTQKDREVTQYLGTACRGLLPDIWINYGLKKIEDQSFVTVTDVRRMNELLALKANGYTLIYVEAPDEVRFLRLNKRDGVSYEDFLRDSAHIAESEIRGLKGHCDLVVYNYAVFRPVKAQLEYFRK